MKSVGRFVATFCLMVFAGYLAILLLLPAPTWRPEDAAAPSAAARLTQEAQNLVAHRSVGQMQ